MKNLHQSARSRFHNKPDEQRQYNFDRHSKRGGFQANPFRRNIRNIHRPSPSFWPAVIVDIFAIAHAQFARCKKADKSLKRRPVVGVADDNQFFGSSDGEVNMNFFLIRTHTALFTLCSLSCFARTRREILNLIVVLFFTLYSFISGFALATHILLYSFLCNCFPHTSFYFLSSHCSRPELPPRKSNFLLFPDFLNEAFHYKAS